ncbi:hypothetical protein CHARACLAT_030695 [Characodon lateralis]|uniref:Uncharacterized protein n=1 Tax=Characodon lateralis TaxID=208331 RepID=A0ABU7D4A0_9TELE|nr:hypothetical protein [Characodon lateralis]
MRRFLLMMEMQQDQGHLKLISTCSKIPQRLLEQVSCRTESFEDNGSGKRNKEKTENICASIIAKLQGSDMQIVLFHQLLGISKILLLNCTLRLKISRNSI